MHILKLKDAMANGVATLVYGPHGTKILPNAVKNLPNNQVVAFYDLSTIDPRCDKRGVFVVTAYKLDAERARFGVKFHAVTGQSLDVAWGEHHLLNEQVELEHTIDDATVLGHLVGGIIDACYWAIRGDAPVYLEAPVAAPAAAPAKAQKRELVHA